MRPKSGAPNSVPGVCVPATAPPVLALSGGNAPAARRIVAPVRTVSGVSGLRALGRLAALALKELAQDRAALLAHHAGGDFDAVIQPRLVDHVQHRATGAGLGIRSAVDQAREPRQHDRPGAHRARPRRPEKGAGSQPALPTGVVRGTAWAG